MERRLDCEHDTQSRHTHRHKAWAWNKGEPSVQEHINVTGEGPLTFRTRDALRKYCRDNSLESGALL